MQSNVSVPSGLYWLSGFVIAAAILNAMAMQFFVPSPSISQYRITIMLLCFALSSIAALLFAANVKVSGKFGIFTATLGGAAALWLGALLVIYTVFPEKAVADTNEQSILIRIDKELAKRDQAIQTAPRQVEFLLLFPADPNDPNRPDPNAPRGLEQALRATGYVQRGNAPAAIIDETFRLRPSPGGLIGLFPNVQPNDLLHVRTDDGTHRWRSYPVLVPPPAVLQMVPEGGQP